MTGYALGGLVALHAAALSDEVDAVAAFGAFTPYRSNGGFLGNARLYDLHAVLPRLGLFQKNEASIPYDFDELLSELVAPRPTLLVTPGEDRNADVSAVDACISTAAQAWSAGALTRVSPDGPTTFGNNETALLVDWVGAL